MQNVSCSIMNKRQTSLARDYTVGEHGRRRYGTHRFSTGKGTCSVVSIIIKYAYPGFFKCFSTLTLRKDCQKCNCSRLPRTSCSSSAINWLCMGTLLSFHPRSIKVSLPSLYPQRHSRVKIFQAFHAFRTASDKSCVEALERGYAKGSSAKNW